MKPPRIWLINSAKVLLSVAVIVAIGFSFVILAPQGVVEEAEADVFWVGPGIGERSNQQKFLKVLEREGFSKPQPYDWNGNIIYFSHGEARGNPRTEAQKLQQAFVDEQLNEQHYPFPPSPDALEEGTSATPEETAYATMATMDYFRGAMIPVSYTEDQVAFNGVDLASDKEKLDGAELMEMFLTFPEDRDGSELIQNFRYVELFRPEGASTTQKIAIFGDGDFKLENHQPGGGAHGTGRSLEEETIPVCPGCQRNSRFSGLESQENYAIYTFNSPDGMDNIIRFYQQALLRRGWRPADLLENTQALQAELMPTDADELMGEMRAFLKGEQMLFLHIYPGQEKGTYVNIFTQ